MALRGESENGCAEHGRSERSPERVAAYGLGVKREGREISRSVGDREDPLASFLIHNDDTMLM
jgi:hypothetical protein